MSKKTDKDWQTQMGWRYVAYGERDEWLSFQIEPMVDVPDLVYVPDEAVWLQNAPSWAQQRRTEILDRLKSVPWNRNLTWLESAKKGTLTLGLKPNEVIPGSLESTLAGRLFERMRLFKPGGRVPHSISHKLWHFAARQFAAVARGEVNIFIGEGDIPDSVFQLIELPALRANPNVVVNIRRVSNEAPSDK